MRTLLLAAALAMQGSTSAQQVNCPIWMHEPVCAQHELGFNLFSWLLLSPDDVIHRDGEKTVGNGVIYKFHCGRNVFRAGADLSRYRYEEGKRPSPDDHYPWYSYEQGRFQDLALRVGYERRLSKGRVQPFVGIDLAYHRTRKLGTYEGRGDFPPYEYAGTTDVTYRQHRISPIVGLTYRFAEHFSIAADASFSYVISRRIEPDDGLHRADRTEVIIDPVRTFSVNYFF
ncbi:MAG: hypothetical protein JNM62_12995 [Flavobacteriales bacterium]|nr:hypothetical protein [Flavobacteriales bacterium]